MYNHNTTSCIEGGCWSLNLTEYLNYNILCNICHLMSISIKILRCKYSYCAV